ncbi:MAG: MarR family transcriptional regulator [Polyangiaceae bacterium]|nr:MarR family transcriptional regulator [Polyangiaceae bacterium]
MASCAEFDLSAAQAYLLQTLDPSKPVPMSSLAGALSCDASNVTGLVDKLEARGFVERQPDPNDRRVKMIALTASGKRVRAEVVDRLATPPASVEALSKTDQEDLVRILKKAVAPPLGRAAGAE